VDDGLHGAGIRIAGLVLGQISGNSLLVHVSSVSCSVHSKGATRRRARINGSVYWEAAHASTSGRTYLLQKLDLSKQVTVVDNLLNGPSTV
jgi:hypothetical protein